MTPELEARLCLMLLGYVFAYVFVLWVVDIAMCRHWVREALRGHGLRPIRVQWRPFAPGNMRCHFNVVYSDVSGTVHREKCWTYWHRPGVYPEPEDLAEIYAKGGAGTGKI